DGFAGAGDWAGDYGAGPDADGWRRRGAADLPGGGWAGDWVVNWRGSGVDGEVYRRWARGTGGEPSGSVCGVSGGGAGACFGSAGGGGLRSLYEPEEHAVLFARCKAAGERGVGGAGVHAEWAGVCADRAATVVCAGRDPWPVWEGNADFLWRGVQCGADFV